MPATENLAGRLSAKLELSKWAWKVVTWHPQIHFSLEKVLTCSFLLQCKNVFISLNSQLYVTDVISQNVNPVKWKMYLLKILMNAGTRREIVNHNMSQFITWIKR